MKTLKQKKTFIDFELNHGLNSNNRKQPKLPNSINYGYKDSLLYTKQTEEAYYNTSPDPENIFYQTSPEEDFLLYSNSLEQENILYQTSQEEDFTLYNKSTEQENILYQTSQEEDPSFYQNFPQFETLKVYSRHPTESKDSDIHSQSFGPENFPSFPVESSPYQTVHSNRRDRAR